MLWIGIAVYVEHKDEVKIPPPPNYSLCGGFKEINFSKLEQNANPNTQ